jgi:hypothetical protein
MIQTDYGVARVRPALPEDAVALAPKLRPADLREIGIFNKTAIESLEDGINYSTKSYAIETPEDGVVGMFGVVATSANYGGVWLLASPGIERIKLTFLRHSAAWLRELARDFRVLGNMVDSRNTLHVHWLTWLGFRFLRKVPVPEKGAELIEFAKLT